MLVMTKLTSALGAILISSSGLWSVPPVVASADTGEYAFVNDVNSLAINAPSAQYVVNTGWQICSMLAGGATVDRVASMLYYNSSDSNSNGITINQAKGVVFYARKDLCPGQL